MGKTQSHRMRRGVGCYKQTLNDGTPSPNWYSRIFMPIGDKKVHIRSTGTTDLAEAIKRTEAFYIDLLLWQRGAAPEPTKRLQQPDTTRRFDHVADACVDSLERDAGQDQKKIWAVRNIKQLLYGVNGLTKFFGKDELDAITTERMREYLRFQVEHSKCGSACKKDPVSGVIGV